MQKNELTFKMFRSSADKGWDEAAVLYAEAFPRCEIRSAADHAAALADPRFHPEGIWCGEEFLGILYWWECPDGTAYIEHLATLPMARNRGVGSRAMERFCAVHERVALEIEPAEDEITRRRKGFYERLGFTACDYLYMHPSFQLPLTPHRLVLMARPAPLASALCRAFEGFVRGVVLHYSDYRRGGNKYKYLRKTGQKARLL